MYGLTHSQAQLFHIICREYEKTGISPSYEEMTKEMGLKAKSGIHRLIHALIERGYIETIPNRARAIRPTMTAPRFREEGNAMAEINRLATAAHFGEMPAIDAVNRILRLTKERTSAVSPSRHCNVGRLT